MISSKVVWDSLEMLNELGKRSSVTFLWVPEYTGVEENKIINDFS